MTRDELIVIVKAVWDTWLDNPGGKRLSEGVADAILAKAERRLISDVGGTKEAYDYPVRVLIFPDKQLSKYKEWAQELDNIAHGMREEAKP